MVKKISIGKEVRDHVPQGKKSATSFGILAAGVGEGT